MFRENASASASPRRNRRSVAPGVLCLEDRKVMTAGFASTMAFGIGAGGGFRPGDMKMAVSSAPTLEVAPAGEGAVSVAGFPGSVSTLPAFDQGPNDAWISIGSDAQFGPAASIALSGFVSAWPTPATPDTPPDAGADPDAEVHAQLNAAFAKQSADTQAIQDKSEVTPKLIAALRQAREKVAAEAGDVGEAALKTLQDATQAVQATGAFTAEQQQTLANAYKAALTGAGVSDATVSELFAAQDAVKAASNVTDADLATLAADQKAVETLLAALPQPSGFDGAAYTTKAFDGGAGGSGGFGQGGGAVAVTTSMPYNLETTTAEPVSTASDLAATTGVVSSVSVTPRDATLAAIGSLPAGVVPPASIRNLPGRYMATPITTPVTYSGENLTGVVNRRLNIRAGGVGSVIRARQTPNSGGNFGPGTANVNNLPSFRSRIGLAGMRTNRFV